MIKQTVIALFFVFSCFQLSANDKIIEDLKLLPQNANPYLKNYKDANYFFKKQIGFKNKYYSPWYWRKAPCKLEECRWPFKTYTYDKKYYGMNQQILPKSFFIENEKNANFENLNELSLYGVSLTRLNLRNFPTEEVLTKNPKKAGEGLPFDYLQNSAVHPNEPIFISHLSKDKKWAYVSSSYATGWVPYRNIAFISAHYYYYYY